MLRYVWYCWLKFEDGQILATISNMSQNVSKGWPNARNVLRPAMFRFVSLTCCHRLAFYFQWSIESGGQAQVFPDERLVINKARGMPKLVLGFSDEDHRPFNEGVPPDIPIEILPLPNDCSVHNQIHQHERLLEVGSPCPTGLVHPGSE